MVKLSFVFVCLGLFCPPPSFLINDATCLDKCIPIILLLKLIMNAQQTCSKCTSIRSWYMYLSSGAFGKYHRGNKPSNIVKNYISAKNRCFDIAFVRNHVKSQNVQWPLQGGGPEGGGVRKPWKTKLSLPLPENLDLLMHYIWFIKMCLDPPPPYKKQDHISPEDISCRAYIII